MRSSRYWVLAAILSLAGLSCAGGTRDPAGQTTPIACGPGGENVREGTASYCVYVVIEGGFECPSALPHFMPVGSGGICGTPDVDFARLPERACGMFGQACPADYASWPNASPRTTGRPDAMPVVDSPGRPDARPSVDRPAMSILGHAVQLTCIDKNIGALREPRPDIRVRCSLFSQTADLRELDLADLAALNLVLVAEAGTLTLQTDPTTGSSTIVHSSLGGVSDPKDVAPLLPIDEPSNAGRNPRDGLVTLLAVMDGMEGYLDTNGNGQHERDEPFFDAPEPFLDENDNGKRDSSEFYVDVDENGQWDGPNGRWDDKTRIMAMFKILWTGALDQQASTPNPQQSDEQITLSDGAQRPVYARALDRNLNPLAAVFHNGDHLAWNLESSGDVTTLGELQPMLHQRGFTFARTASTELDRWRIEPGSFDAPFIRLDLTDHRIADAQPATDFSLAVTVTVTPGSGPDGRALEPVTETLTGQYRGTAD